MSKGEKQRSTEWKLILMKEPEYFIKIQSQREGVCGRDLFSHVDLWKGCWHNPQRMNTKVSCRGQGPLGPYFQPPSPPASFPWQTSSLQHGDSRVLAPKTKPGCRILTTMLLFLLPALLFYVAQSMCLATFQNSTVKRRHGKSHK